MKKSTAFVLTFLLVIDIGAQFARPRPALAQTGNSIIVLGVATSLSGCAWPSGATVTNGMAVCPTLISGVNGLALAVNGGPFTALNQGGGGGVLTVNGRSGAVVLGTGDLSFAQLSAPPTSETCSTATHSNGGLSASGCLFK